MTDNLRAIVAVLIASAAFVLNDALIKLASSELPSGEIIVVRGTLTTAMLTVGVIVLGARRPLRMLLTPMMLLRLGSAAASTIFIVLALRELPLATFNAVLQMTPLAVIAGAAVIYGEKVGWRRWLATLAGFTGVMMIVRPGGASGTAAYLALTALLFTTTRDLTTRGLHHDIPSIFVAAGSAAFITVGGFAVIPFDAAWSMPTARGWLLLVSSAACMFVATTFVIIALRTGEIAVVAPFRYTQMPLSILLGYWWWGDMPDVIAFLGIGLVVIAGLYTLQRERHSLVAGPTTATLRSAAE